LLAKQAEHWKTALTFNNSHPRLLCTPALFLNYSSRYSISHTHMTAVLQTYVTLQEGGGETDEPLHRSEALQAQGHTQDADSLTAYLFPSGGIPTNYKGYLIKKREESDGDAGVAMAAVRLE
jgi:hypothetical protein